MTVPDVVAMTRSGVDEGLIINHIHAHGLAAPLQATDVIYLQQQGVSRNVIAVMQTEPVAVRAQVVPVYEAPPSGGVIIEERGDRATIAPTGTTISLSGFMSRQIPAKTYGLASAIRTCTPSCGMMTEKTPPSPHDGRFRLLFGPVFTREVVIAPRRTRIYIARSAYAAALLLLICTAWLVLTGTQIVRDVSDLAQFAGLVFQILAPLQLALAVFFSAMLAASAVAQEKDRRTFVLLLLTNLSNQELVLGKLLASLLQVLVMFAAGLPVFMLLSLLGGISVGQIARTAAVTVASILVCGSLGSTLALWREKTFQALALFVLILVLWLALGEMLAAGVLGHCARRPARPRLGDGRQSLAGDPGGLAALHAVDPRLGMARLADLSVSARGGGPGRAAQRPGRGPREGLECLGPG